MNDSSKSAKPLSRNLYKVQLLLPVSFQPDMIWTFQMFELPRHCFLNIVHEPRMNIRKTEDFLCFRFLFFQIVCVIEFVSNTKFLAVTLKNFLLTFFKIDPNKWSFSHVKDNLLAYMLPRV